MRRRFGMFIAAWAISAPGGSLVHGAEIVLRAQVSSHAAEVVEETETLKRVEIPVHPGETVPLEIEIVITSQFDACLSNAETCTAGEDGLAGECNDGVDNDSDGLVDFADPDCIGVQGYVLAVGTDASFHLRANDLPEDQRGASFYGTLSDDYTRPPGIARPPLLRYVDPVDPERNGGQEGVVGVCILSSMAFVILPPNADSTVLKLRGDLDISGLNAGDKVAPCLIDIRSPGEDGLASMGDPLTTAMTVSGNTFPHATQDLQVVLRIEAPPIFRRGDANGDGVLDVSDVLFILNFLFAGGRAPTCLDSADTDGNDALQITDGIAIFEFLFFGNSPPPPPGPFDCGPDPTVDEISCEAFPNC